MPIPITIFQTLVDTAVTSAQLLSLELTPRQRVAHSGGRHLALFARALPPHSGAGVHRPLSFMRYGAAQGWRIDAFGGEAPPSENQHGDELLARVPASTTLHVVPLPTREPSYRLWPRIDGGFTNALEYSRMAIDLLQDDPPDAVLASGPPFFVFVAAFYASRHFGVPLILDYRDEWTECPFDFVSKEGDDVSWEHRCLADADAVLFTTVSHRERALSVFPELDPAKAHVVPNGWDPDEFTLAPLAPRSNARADDALLRLAHVGNLAGHTPPFDFLNSLRQLFEEDPSWQSCVEISFIGRRSPSADKAIREFEYPGVLRLVDHVGKVEATQRMQDSDALLLLSAPDLERYLPSKLYDYLAARRPVLVFGAPGESSALVQRLDAGALCAPGSGRTLASTLSHLRSFDLRTGDLRVQHWLDAHRRDVLAAQAFEIIDSVMARS